MKASVAGDGISSLQNALFDSINADLGLKLTGRYLKFSKSHIFSCVLTSPEIPNEQFPQSVLFLIILFCLIGEEYDVDCYLTHRISIPVLFPESISPAREIQFKPHLPGPNIIIHCISNVLSFYDL